MGAVSTRLAPVQAIGMLQAFFLAMELTTATEWEVYGHACRLAVKLNHHLFDTLYYAIAIQFPDCVFITADTQYVRKAARLGNILD